MSKTKKIIVSSSLLIFGISLSTIGVLQSDFSLANLLASSAQELGDSIKFETVGTENNLSYGSETEVYRFSIDSNQYYTIRYIGFEFTHSGLDWSRYDDAKDWEVFEVSNGIADFRNEVGIGTDIKNGLLRVKMYSQNKTDSGFIGGPVKKTFVLVTEIIDDKLGSPNIFSVRIPGEFPEGFDLAWVRGAYLNSWGTIEGRIGSDEVLGLPTEELVSTGQP